MEKGTISLITVSAKSILNSSDNLKSYIYIGSYSIWGVDQKEVLFLETKAVSEGRAKTNFLCQIKQRRGYINSAGGFSLSGIIEEKEEEDPSEESRYVEQDGVLYIVSDGGTLEEMK